MPDPTLTAAELDALAALYAQATPGEWLVEMDNCHAGRIAAFHGDEPQHYYEVWSAGWMERGIPQHVNADLVASLHNAFPALLALARRGAAAQPARKLSEERIAEIAAAEFSGRTEENDGPRCARAIHAALKEAGHAD